MHDGITACVRRDEPNAAVAGWGKGSFRKPFYDTRVRVLTPMTWKPILSLDAMADKVDEEIPLVQASEPGMFTA